MVLIWGAFGYVNGETLGWAKELSAFAGMIFGGIVGAVLLKRYEKKGPRSQHDGRNYGNHRRADH